MDCVEFQFDDIYFRAFEDGHCETVFPDGSVAHGVAHDTDEYRQHAKDLGYGEGTGRDATLMCWEHELLHTVVAFLQGKTDGSPILAQAARGEEFTQEQRDFFGPDEGRVLEFQKKLQALRKLALTSPG